MVALLLALSYLVLKLAGVNFPIGNPTIVILVSFFSGVQLLSLGIIGEYVGRNSTMKSAAGPSTLSSLATALIPMTRSLDRTPPKPGRSRFAYWPEAWDSASADWRRTSRKRSSRLVISLFFSISLASLAQQGATYVVLCVGHMGELIEKEIGHERFGVTIAYSYDGPGNDGTLGAIGAPPPFLDRVSSTCTETRSSRSTTPTSKARGEPATVPPL